MKRQLHLLALAMAVLANPVHAQVSPPVLKVEDGGTGAGNAGRGARSNLGAAAAGANNDITSLYGLTTPLPASEGGTGGAGGVSPTGSLTTTPEAVINVADFGGCSGAPTSDTANLNAALAAARSLHRLCRQPTRALVGGYSHHRSRLRGDEIECHRLHALWRRRASVDRGSSAYLHWNRKHLPRYPGFAQRSIQQGDDRRIASSPPMIGLQEGNISPSNTACCIHTHYGLEITGSYTFAGLYSAASESTTYYSPIMQEQRRLSRRRSARSEAFPAAAGYANGTYNGVVLTGSATGAGALATVAVSGGVVTSVTLTNQGKQYAIGDTLTASASSLGGSGRRFHVPVANIAQFAMVMDGQNHWGVSSAFQSVTWPADTYYTFTEDNIIGGSLRYYGSAYKGAPLWIGSVEGLRTVHLYTAQLAAGPCVYLYDNNAAFTSHNVGEVLEISASLRRRPMMSSSQDQMRRPTSAASNCSISKVRSIPPFSASTRASPASSPTAPMSTCREPLPTCRCSASATANLWNFDGVVNLQFAWEYNAPASSLVQGLPAAFR